MSRRLKSLAGLVVDQAGRGELPYLALEHLEGGTGALVPQVELPFRRGGDPGTSAVKQGDVLFGKLRPYLAKTLLVREPAYASTELMALRPYPAVEARYLAYLVGSRPLIEWATASSDGTKMPRTSWEKLGEFRVDRLPTTAVQRAIADYLDTETARIDTLIAKKQRLIELLDERLQVERRRSFTDNRGWRLKHLLRAPMAYGILVPQFVEPESGVRMLRITNLDGSGGVALSEVVWVPRSLSNEYRRTLVVSGDLVVSVVGSMGRSSVISGDVEGSNLNRALARVQLRADLDPWIMWHWTQTTDFLDQARLATGGGTAQPTLNLGDLSEFTVGLPTDPNEWPRIAANLSKAFEAHRSVTSRLRHQIELLREHRQALITAAVTGELEIPEVAA